MGRDMTEQHLSQVVADGVLTLTLTRADKKNALTRAMYQGMADAFAAANADDRVNALLLKGSGGSFTAGNDLKDFAEGPREGPSPAHAFLHNLINLEKPIVAAVDGVAVGIGTTLLMHCDYVIASPTARFATPFVDLGLCPEGGSSMLMPARLGRAAAVRLLMLGDRLEAEEARACGLVDQIAPDVDAAGAELAARLAAKPAQAMRSTKKLIRAAETERLLAHMDQEFETFAERLASPEAQAAFRAFLSK